MAESSQRIPSLRDSYDAWRGWKVHLQAILNVEDLWEIVGTGTETRPTEIVLAQGGGNQNKVDARNSEIAAFDTKVKRAVRSLVTNIHGELFYLWGGEYPTDPRQIWRVLTEHFQAQSHSHRVSVRSQLDSLSLKDKEDPEIWIKKRIRLYQQYAESGQAIPQSEQVIETLNNLPYQWKDFKNLMHFGIVGELNMTLLASKLVDWVRVNKSSASGNSGDSSRPRDQQAHAAGGGWRGKKFRGHSTAGGNSDLSTVRCYKCKKFGHFARDCSNKKPSQSQGGKRDSAQAAKTCHSDSEDSFLVHDFLLCATNVSRDVIVVDSGCTRHMTSCREAFRPDFKLFATPSKVKIADGDTVLEALGSGSLGVDMSVGGVTKSVVLRDCLYVPKLQYTLWSVPQTAKKGHIVQFDSEGVTVCNKAGEVMCRGKLWEKLYRMDGVLNVGTSPSDDSLSCSESLSLEASNVSGGACKNVQCCELEDCYSAVDAQMWHRRFAHINPVALHKIAQTGCVKNLSITGSTQNLPFCVACAEGKMHVLPFPKSSETRENGVLDKWHLDLMGPIQVKSVGGKFYCMVVVDDFSRFSFVRFLAKKSDTFDVFKKLLAQIENQQERKLKVLRSDCGGEFINKPFSDFFGTARNQARIVCS